MNQSICKIERHPLEPFLPEGAKLLILGSFPPGRERWSMEFFYPNRQNDMWRIMGLIFFDDKNHFLLADNKHFDRASIVAFCQEIGLALYDTAYEVRRLKANASDKFLEVVTPTDIEALLTQIPQCRAIVTTGQKASEIVVSLFGCEMPAIGSFTTIETVSHKINFWRMPSTSRAYPLAPEKKAEFYKKLLATEGIISAN